MTTIEEVIARIASKDARYLPFVKDAPQGGACRFKGAETGGFALCPPCGDGIRKKLFVCSYPEHDGVCTMLDGGVLDNKPVPGCNSCPKRELLQLQPPPPVMKEAVPGAAVVIGTYGQPDLARLQVRLIRDTCGPVPILIADDGSEHDRAFDEIVRANIGVEFWPSDARRGHYAGDLSVFSKGLQWAHNAGHRWLCKLSQRFLWTAEYWLKNAVETLAASTHAIMMQKCMDSNDGRPVNLYIRSECVLFDVPKWVPYYREFDLGEICNPTELYLWHRVHQYFGEKFEPWPGMTEDRYAVTPGSVWHGSHSEQPYRELAARYGIDLGPDFDCGGAQHRADWKRG